MRPKHEEGSAPAIHRY